MGRRDKVCVLMEESVKALHQKAHRVAIGWYLRKGHVPKVLLEIMQATVSLEAFAKYRPEQPRVPAGHPDGSLWRWYPDGRMMPKTPGVLISA